MSNRLSMSIASFVSAVLLVAAFGTDAVADSRTCRDLQADITAIKQAIGIVNGKVDQSNQSSAALLLALETLDAKADQSRIVTPAEGVRLGADYLVIGRPITGAADPRATLAAIRAELPA